MPSNRDDTASPGVTLAAPEPALKIGDPHVGAEPQPVGQGGRRNHQVVSAVAALDVDEITWPRSDTRAAYRGTILRKRSVRGMFSP
jgi:hypothetical protein